MTVKGGYAGCLVGASPTSTTQYVAVVIAEGTGVLLELFTRRPSPQSRSAVHGTELFSIMAVTLAVVVLLHFFSPRPLTSFACHAGRSSVCGGINDASAANSGADIVPPQ